MEILDLQNTTGLSLLQILESINEVDFTRIGTLAQRGVNHTIFSLLLP